MIKVDLLFTGDAYQTQVYVSDAVRKALMHPKPKLADKRLELLEKIRFYARNGFKNYEYGKGAPIKSEGNRVYRIGLSDDLFRVIGFYDDEKTKSSFILIDTYTKKDRKNNASHQERIRKTARIRGSNSWEVRK